MSVTSSLIFLRQIWVTLLICVASNWHLDVSCSETLIQADSSPLVQGRDSDPPPQGPGFFSFFVHTWKVVFPQRQQLQLTRKDLLETFSHWNKLYWQGTPSQLKAAWKKVIVLQEENASEAYMEKRLCLCNVTKSAANFTQICNKSS